MAVPKKYKKQVKAAMGGSTTSSTSKTSRSKRSKRSSKKREIKWAFKNGDLVEHNGQCCFIMNDNRGDGWFELMSPDGNCWAKAKDIVKLQELQNDDSKHANKA